MSARHWSTAIWLHVEPAPLICEPAAAGAAGSTSATKNVDASTTASARRVALACRRAKRSTISVPFCRSAEAAADVVERARVGGTVEDRLGPAGFHDAAGLVLAGEEERARMRHTLRLLHVVRDDHDRHVRGDVGDRLLDA